MWNVNLCFLMGALFLVACGKREDTSPFATGRIDIPQVSNIAVDGGLEDWLDQGYRIQVWTMTGMPAEETNDIAATAILGWENDDLLLAFSIRDNQFEGPDQDASNRSHDHVRLIISDQPESNNGLELIISPGLMAEMTEPQMELIDHRPAPAEGATVVPLIEPTIQISRSNLGYSMEVRLPLVGLGFERTPHAPPFALYLEIADKDPAEALMTLLHFVPTLREDWKDQWLAVRRTVAPGPPIPLSAVTAFDSFAAPTLQVQAISELAGKAAVIVHGKKTLAAAVLAPDPKIGRCSAVIQLPEIPIEDEKLPIEVQVEKTTMGISKLPDLEEERELMAAQSGGRLELMTEQELRESGFIVAGFPEYVLNTNTFPQPDFVDSNRVLELMKTEPTITATFFNSEGEEVTEPSEPGRYGAVLQVDFGNGITESVRRTLVRDIDEAPERELVNEKGAIAIAAELEAGRELTAEDPDPEVLNQQWWDQLRLKKGEIQPYRYAVLFPDSYGTSADQQWPVLFYFGDPESSEGALEAFHAGGYDHQDLVVVIPLGDGQPWRKVLMEAVVAEILKDLRIDPKRQYLAAYDPAAKFAWDWVLAEPGRFAGLLAMGGEVPPRDKARLFRGHRILVAYGGLEPEADITAARNLVGSIRYYRSAGQFKLYPEIGGADVQASALGDEELWDWLLDR